MAERVTSGMLVRCFRDPHWLSNSWLLADRAGGHAVVVDTGGPFPPLAAAVEELRLTVDRVLLTHHHPDHIAHNADCRAAFGCPLCAHAADARWMRERPRAAAPAYTLVEDGAVFAAGGLRIRALHVPGHTAGQLAFLVAADDEPADHLLTGDTLFRGSVGGTIGHGASGFADLKRSLLERMLALPDATVVLPGHMEPTTIGRERAENPFLRAFAAPGRPSGHPCTVRGAAAELLLRAPDYDGGTKAWVRLEDGQEAVVPGSLVE